MYFVIFLVMIVFELLGIIIKRKNDGKICIMQLATIISGAISLAFVGTLETLNSILYMSVILSISGLFSSSILVRRWFLFLRC